MDKEELRKDIRQQKRHFSSDELAEMSLPVIGRLLANSRMAKAGTVMMYYSLPDEVCTHDAIALLVERGCSVVLPVVTGDSTMELREYHGRQELTKGPFGILEPTGKVFTEYDKIDVAVIPGMSFDSEGNRLGRGKGYYDRFLSQHPHIYKIGVCFDFQKRASIPVGKNDVRMEEVN